MEQSATTFTFGSLNFLRKLWVTIVVSVNGGIGLTLLTAPFHHRQLEPMPLFVAAGVLALAVAFLTYDSVSQRKVGVQKYLLVFNLLFANVIGALIMLLIIRASKKELATRA